MSALTNITDAEFEKLLKNSLDDYFAKPKDRKKLTDPEVRDLADRISKRIDIPIIKATTEIKIYIKLIVKIDNFLYDNLPNEFYDLIRSADKGIDDDEAKRLVVRLSHVANQKINIPYIPEAAEYLLIKLLLGIIMNAARKGWDMAKAKIEENDIFNRIPNKGRDNDKNLELLIA